MVHKINLLHIIFECTLVEQFYGKNYNTNLAGQKLLQAHETLWHGQIIEIKKKIQISATYVPIGLSHYPVILYNVYH